ncbi:MAG: hypothetical protein D6800_03205 [Candidatus Zixiibacteriota bacterium]|nr:MAG: hypothetical protein D6800_03205 [candidate division Zixibacteria bacterium]
MEPVIQTEPEEEKEDVQAQYEDMLARLQEELGVDRVPPIVADVALSDEIAAFLLKAEDRITELVKATGGKVDFYLHREPNNDLYLLRSLKPSEWNSTWFGILMQNITEEQRDAYVDQLLSACMVYPSYDETAWDWEPEKINAPSGMTKNRLVGTFFENNIQDPNTPSSVAFDPGEAQAAIDVARKKQKPSL